MDLSSLLLDRKRAILDRWRAAIFGAYPPSARQFLSSESDAFANPVGAAIRQATEAACDWLARDGAGDPPREAMDGMLRARAVQELAPGQALRFVFELREALRAELSDFMSRPQGLGLWLDLEAKLDALALLAFEIYAECREKTFEIRIDAIKRDALGIAAKRSAPLFVRGAPRPLAPDANGGCAP
ncbi:MAG: hypothetical protein BWZ10_00463 [candidate division BRC1 bacterium ADurb.BinA364]|nr:MAG: hypothetical protein BWZ10_00463 [candidate division BRC1 bacterium ADurb.BinA364]